MTKGKFNESQIVAILNEGEAGLAVAELCRKHGISAATYYAWRSKYAGASVSDVTSMRKLVAENARLMRMITLRARRMQRDGRLLQVDKAGAATAPADIQRKRGPGNPKAAPGEGEDFRSGAVASRSTAFGTASAGVRRR